MAWVEENGIDIGWNYTDKQGNDVWVMKDGKQIKITDMEDSHLLNAYKKFDDDRLMREMVIRLFEAKVRGEK